MEEKSYVVREMIIKYKSKGKVEKNPLHLSSPEEVYAFMKSKLEHETEEVFIALYLNNKNGEAGWKELSRGTVSESLVHPREIFKFAYLCNASAVIVLHNHPSGECEPSKEDMETTKRIKEAGEFLGIQLLDHLIIGEGSFYSMKAGGYLDSDKCGK